MNLARAGYLRIAFVWQTDVRDVEVDEIGAVVVAFSEGDWEADLPNRGSGAAGHS